MLKLERIKDYLLMEEEFIKNQERLKPQEEKHEVRQIVVSLLKGFDTRCSNLSDFFLNHVCLESDRFYEVFVLPLKFGDLRFKKHTNIDSISHFAFRKLN